MYNLIKFVNEENLFWSEFNSIYVCIMEFFFYRFGMVSESVFVMS